jgi:predicted nucleic acid-binding protein
VRGFVLDAGAFIALERRSPFMIGILNEALHGTIEVVLPRTVIAQVWRGTPRQANLGRLVSAGLRRGSPVVIDELTAERAREIGVTIGQVSHPDIVDVHVALAAVERGHAVLTSDDSDDADIAKVNRDLILVHV